MVSRLRVGAAETETDMTETREPLTTAALVGMGKVTFDVEPCGRCGGSGRYSFNMTHGSVCYGCSGAGKVRTRAAKLAAAKLGEVKPKIAITDLIPGDQVMLSGRWWTIIERVEPRSARVLPDGSTIPDVSVRMERRGQTQTYSAPEGTKLRRPFTPAEYAEYLEYARALAGVNVTDMEA